MTATLSFVSDATDTFDQTPAQHHPYRWRLARAGFVNVWHYYENTFDMSGGRLILRGTNGSGKSRALEMLLPFLLDADRRNMGTGSSVRMEDLMSAGAADQGNRLGYMWLELCRDPDPAETDNPARQYLTLGALVRFSISTKEAKVWYFTTPLRVGHELYLLGPNRQPLSRRELGELVGEDHITDVPEKHRERVRVEVCGLTGQLGKERFEGLVKLLHTLRSPDVGNRIEEGKLPAILTDALPPLSEDALTDAGQQLDGLTSTREDQERLETARGHVRTFLDAYRKYVTGVLTASIEQAKDGAKSARQADGEASRLAQQTEALEKKVAGKRARLAKLEEDRDTLAATLEALKESDAYRSAEDLAKQARVTEAQANTADGALAAAAELRGIEAGKVDEANAVADEVAEAAANATEATRLLRELLTAIGLTEHDLPPAVASQREPVAQRMEIIRTRRDSEPEEIIRPAPDVLTLVPTDLTALATTIDQVRQAAVRRSGQARNRAADARSLAEERQKVVTAAEKADEADQRAQDDTDTAQEEADNRDDAAIALVDRWRTWLTGETTVDLLGVVDWSSHPLLRPLLTERTALCGDVDAPIALSDLDRAADEAAATARDGLTRALKGLSDADAADQSRVDELTAEQTRLLADHDPDPEPPAWVSRTDGVPLWRCLDFAEHVSEEHRAGIEAALLASGMLVATVDEHGRLTAANGQLLLSPLGERVATPLTAVLLPDPAAPLRPEAIIAVLDRIALEDRTVHTWIGRDGSWGNGPLRGRHIVATARHIGAAARAAARAQRLTEIDIELRALSEAADARQQQREKIEERQRALRGHLLTAPRSALLAEARTRAASAAARAAKSTAEAQRVRTRADKLAREWAEKDRQHRRACAEFGLPVDEQPLTELRHRADTAAAKCQDLTRALASLDRQLSRHGAAVQAVADLARRRTTAERKAADEWANWRAEATRLEVLTEAVGAAAAEVQRQVTRTIAQLEEAKGNVKTTGDQLNELTAQAATAATEAKAAAAHANALRTDLSKYVAVILNQLAQPGITATAFASAPGTVFSDLAAGAVETDAATLLNGLRRTTIDENALIRAQQTFEQVISGSYDVSATISAGVRLFELVDAEGRRPLAQAAVEITRQCELGRATLTEREQRVFTEFVLGEVGEELRRRLSQAAGLIAAMNTSLKSIRTSHGIGVRLTWKLSEDASGDIARIKELITTAASVRTPVQDAELTGLLSARVAAEAVKDPKAGYATHLRSALDYRAWHVVDVIITGPEEGRERRISRRAKLSQGETRFVSYVTLFAAVDAYLSGLPNTALSLRLILLDDAFAKVDEPTIAELLGLLVRLDVDFAMTGHALWGCVPQVPALDIYEICREDGSPAATAHVRWDGRNRHFLRAA